MTFKKKDIESKLVRKFAFREVRKTGHTFYTLHLEGLPKLRTHASGRHSRRTSVGRPLESEIAAQVGVRVPFFRGMIDCSRSREDYYKELQDHPERIKATQRYRND